MREEPVNPRIPPRMLYAMVIGSGIVVGSLFNIAFQTPWWGLEGILGGVLSGILINALA
jgi:hypothetical protein